MLCAMQWHAHHLGSEVTLTIWRNRREEQVRVTLGELSTAARPAQPSE